MNAIEFFSVGNHGSYKSFVDSQLETIEFNEVKIVDIGNKTFDAFRMNLSKFSNRTGVKFKTKVVNGELHVGRVL